jgi:dipeptidase E
MKKLFLSSYFKYVANAFVDFTHDHCKGKKVIFIPTAGAVDKTAFYVKADRKALEKLGLIVEDLEITKTSYEVIKEKIRNTDYIFVSGGNTFFLLQELKRTGTDKLIIEHINKGKLYIGSSAGSAILTPNIEYLKSADSPKLAPNLHNDFRALGIIDFYIMPHTGNFPFRRIAKKIIEEYTNKIDLRAISNNQVITVNDDVVTIVSN